MSLNDAIKTYHDLLTDEVALESQDQLDRQLNQRGLFFGDKPLSTVLRPRFLMPQQYNYMRRSIRPLLTAFGKISEAAVANPDFRHQFRMLDWEEDLIQIDPGFSSHTPLTRLDAFFMTDSGDMKFTEYNAEVPAASAYNDVLTKVFLGLPVMGQFLHRYVVRSLMTRHDVLHVLLHAYKEWGGIDRPNIAILDWREVPTYSEFELFIRFFIGQGFECRIVDPRDVECREGGLYAGDFKIDLIYKRVLITELIERGGIDHPVVRAVREGKVCMVNPFRCKILYKKTSLAVLSDEENQHMFAKDELNAIQAHIPWTRTVEERKTTYNDLPVDLIPFILKYQERFVLKPNDDYGGRGIVLGWQTNASGWEQAVTEALETPFVVQERVSIPEEPYPSIIDGRLQIFNRMLDTAPFVFYGNYVDGCLTRLSTDPLLNVSAGGGSSVPTFIVEKR